MSTPDSDIISNSKCTSCRKPLGKRKILTLTEQQWKICKPCYKKLYGDMKKTEQYKLEANMKKMIIGVKVLVTSQTICGVPGCTNELVFGKAFMNQELQKRTCISCYGKLYRQRSLKIEAEKVRNGGIYFSESESESESGDESELTMFLFPLWATIEAETNLPEQRDSGEDMQDEYQMVIMAVMCAALVTMSSTKDGYK
ncbi:hypothetical protein GCK72_021529 [Caenorhabditis remanei]|uniref:Uncharacterized protein n=1 Tax=Caenorhabditis remanei TaxID=31234 RepID=A0A6A5GJW7_CAERE|nr:hypothetical protein GCK72_021529 [Caenorhabditis remanei]KAF1754963.1 hypothetical protein GCK72_021529 [Caenorhabditis remanei]